MNDLTSLLGMAGNTVGSLGKGLWGGVEKIGQGFAQSGLDKLLGTGVDLWGAYNQDKLQKDLLGQRQTELGMTKEAFDRDKRYQDRLANIDWSSTQAQ